MPLFNHLTFKLYDLVLWHITESEKELQDGIVLHPSDKNKLSTCKNPVRKAEFLALRQCLRTYFGYNPEVFYHPTGKPYLLQDYNISFSHTRKFACMIISKSLEVGVDLEVFRENVQKIQPKFMRKEESKMVQDHPVQHLTAYWSAKEVIVKILGDRKLDFKREIRLEPLVLKPMMQGRGHVFKNNMHRSCYLLFKNYGKFMLTYGWEER